MSHWYELLYPSPCWEQANMANFQWNGAWCQTCSPTHYAHFVFKTATQQFCTGYRGADGVRQPRQLRVARVATLWTLYWTAGWECLSSFWSCGIFCMQQYTCNHPYMLFVFPGQKQAKKRTILLRECAKNSSPNAAGRSCNSCRRHMISSQYIYIHICSIILLWNYIYTHCISYHAGFGKYATPPAQHQCGTCQSVRTRKRLRMIEVWDFHRSSASDSSTACLRNWQDWSWTFCHRWASHAT